MNGRRPLRHSLAARTLRAGLAVVAVYALLAVPVAAGLPMAVVPGGTAGTMVGAMADTMAECGGACPLMAVTVCETGAPAMDCCVAGNPEQRPGQAASTPSGPQLAAPAAGTLAADVTPRAAGLAAGAPGRQPLPAGTPLYTLHSSLLN